MDLSRCPNLAATHGPRSLMLGQHKNCRSGLAQPCEQRPKRLKPSIYEAHAHNHMSFIYTGVESLRSLGMHDGCSGLRVYKESGTATEASLSRWVLWPWALEGGHGRATQATEATHPPAPVLILDQ